MNDNPLHYSADELDGQDLDGAELLGELHAALARYVVFPSADAADAVTLWIAATHGVNAWHCAPRLDITSPVKRCGKSRLLDVIGLLAADPLITSDLSADQVPHCLTSADVTRCHLALSNEREMWLRRVLAAEVAGFARGREAGYREGREAEAADRDAAWLRIARPVARGGPSFAELERRRWRLRDEQRTRESFGEPHPDDYQGDAA